mmetsp:Transcript_6625/g.20143  ORF Transcript_6625/g.20143 Transcript_6625/m.20143 type:complete len:360 (+) Transcript_6625:77-1156(+)
MTTPPAPVFAPVSEAIDYISQVDLDEIFDDCFMTSEWLVPFEENPPPLPASGAGEAAVKAEEPVGVVAQKPAPRAGEVKADSRADGRSSRSLARRYYGLEEEEDDEAALSGGLEKGRRRANGRKRRRPVESKSLTDEQRVERRERNREHAKRSRIRKKFLLESLLEQVQELRGENEELRRAIRDGCPETAHDILQSCSTEESLLLCAEPTSSPIGTTQQLMEPDFRLMMALQASQRNFAVSDPSLPDNPIVYASKGFLHLTGYRVEQVVGRNCRFLQGPGTDPKVVDVIRKGVADGVDTSVCLLNYKADGTPFWNQFFVAALRDADGKIVNFVGVQCQVNQVPIDEIKERAKRMALLDI